MKVAVIGAGIVGASVAFRLAQGGADVTVVDRGGPASGTTSASFAWVNANQKTPRAYHELNVAGMREHLHLREELGEAPWLHVCGNLMWTDDRDPEDLRRRVERLRSWDYPVRWLRASEVKDSLEPNVDFPKPDTPVAYFSEESWADAPQLTDRLIQFATRHGAMVRSDARIESVELEDNGLKSIRLGDGESIAVDAVVNAAGPGADLVASMFGARLPLAPTSGLLARLAVEDAPVGRVMHTPGVNLRPDGGGYVLAHHEIIDRRLRQGEDVETLAEELLERARVVLPILEDAKVARTTVGVRAIPEDGFPCVGAVPSLPGHYEAVTHSGVTLGPLVGRLLVVEILSGERDPLLAPFRPERFERAPR